MAQIQVPPINPSDPNSITRAFRAIEAILNGQGSVVSDLEGNQFLDRDVADLPPDSSPVPISISSAMNTDGSLKVVLTWEYVQGLREATFFIIYLIDGTAPIAEPDSGDQFAMIPADTPFYVFPSLPSDHTYRFGVAAARETINGLQIGAIQSPAGSPDWVDVTGWTPDYRGGLPKFSGNMVPNPSFETPEHAWAVYVASGAASGTWIDSDSKYGQGCIELVVTGAGDLGFRSTHPVLGESASIPVLPLTTYAFAVWVKRVAGTGTVGLRIIEWDSGGGVDGDTTLATGGTSSWTRFTGQLTTTATTAFISIRLGTNNTGTGTFRFDGSQSIRGASADLPDFDGPQFAPVPGTTPNTPDKQIWLGSLLGAAVATLASDTTIAEAATWTPVMQVSVSIPLSADVSAVFLLANLGVKVTQISAGSIDVYWRILRGATVLRTSYKSTSTQTGNLDIPALFHVDVTPGIGTVTYYLEMQKVTSSGSYTVEAKTPGALAALPWSN